MRNSQPPVGGRVNIVRARFVGSEDDEIDLEAGTKCITQVPVGRRCVDGGGKFPIGGGLVGNPFLVEADAGGVIGIENAAICSGIGANDPHVPVHHSGSGRLERCGVDGVAPREPGSFTGVELSRGKNRGEVRSGDVFDNAQRFLGEERLGLSCLPAGGDVIVDLAFDVGNGLFRHWALVLIVANTEVLSLDTLARSGGQPYRLRHVARVRVARNTLGNAAAADLMYDSGTSRSNGCVNARPLIAANRFAWPDSGRGKRGLGASHFDGNALSFNMADRFRADRRPLGNCPRRQPDSCESAFLSIYPLRTSTPPVVGSLAGFGNAIRPCDRGRRSVWSDLRFGQLPGRRRSGRNSAGRLDRKSVVLDNS